MSSNRKSSRSRGTSRLRSTPPGFLFLLRIRPNVTRMDVARALALKDLDNSFSQASKAIKLDSKLQVESRRKKNAGKLIQEAMRNGWVKPVCTSFEDVKIALEGGPLEKPPATTNKTYPFGFVKYLTTGRYSSYMQEKMLKPIRHLSKALATQARRELMLQSAVNSINESKTLAYVIGSQQAVVDAIIAQLGNEVQQSIWQAVSICMSKAICT